jgi:hypothetical protein
MIFENRTRMPQIELIRAVCVLWVCEEMDNL